MQNTGSKLELFDNMNIGLRAILISLALLSCETFWKESYLNSEMAHNRLMLFLKKYRLEILK